MDSSTLPFEPPRPVRASTLLLIACATWAACIFYTLYQNPEVAHYAEGARLKTAWAKTLTDRYGHKTVVFGGSSCEFSIDGERLLDLHQLPVTNFGGHAGMGAPVLAEAALGAVRPGDTLIVAIEQSLLTGSANQTSLGIQFSAATHHPEWVNHPALGVGATNWIQILAALRPGGYHTGVLLGKLLHGQPVFSYPHSTYRGASGWSQSVMRHPFHGPEWFQGGLSPGGCQLLQNLKAWCDAHQVRIAYALPWCYSSEQDAPRFRRDNQRLLIQIAAIMPVLKDPKLGAYTEREHFADTAYHLNEAGVAARCAELARGLKAWEVWSPAELESWNP
ncbi:MAG: hypothetical protein QM715_07365 [Nibricoccus sp.]